MIYKTILYSSILIAFIAFFILYDKGFSFKNSLIMSLFAPLIGGLLILAGVFGTTLLMALSIAGANMFLINRNKLKKLKSKNLKFKVYRI